MHCRHGYRALAAVSCIAWLACGGNAAEAVGAASGDQQAVSQAPMSPPAPVAETLPVPDSTAPAAPACGGPGSSSGEGGASSASVASVSSDCSSFSRSLISDFVAMTFRNDTAGTIYLASTNAHCGAWPAFVEFSQTAAAVELFVGDCFPDCGRLIESGYRGEGVTTAEACGMRTSCPTPFRAIAPGEAIYQLVSPLQDAHYRLSRSCVPDAPGESIECVTTTRLAPGTYSLRATAYRDITCSGSSCSCERQQMLDWCHSPGGTQPPVSCGAPLHAEATLELSSALGLHAELVFSE